MIPIRVTCGGKHVALIHFFGHHVYDRTGWPRVRETDGETAGWAVVSGKLPAAVIGQLRDAVIRSPVTGIVGEFAYQVDEPSPGSSRTPRRSRSRRR
jgi:hypothetical protein